MSLADVRSGRSLRFDAGELSGALGDSVTVLPLVVALGALTPISVGTALFWFGVFQLLWGLLYGLPLSVEPMKALVGLTIAGAITAAACVAGVVVAFPTAVLGVLLVLVAWHLGRAAARSDRLPLVCAVGVVGLLTNVGAAFLVGAVAGRILDRVESA